MPIEIHGKEYYTVVERLGMLKDAYKRNYSLTTKFLHYDNEVVVVQATLSIDGNEYTGIAEEMRNSSRINKTSAVENCETSAIGRALSSAGYYRKEFCSANELENALEQQNAKPTTKPSPKTAEVKHTVVTEDPNDDSPTIKFGKHKGQKWNTLDESYLKWLMENAKVDSYREMASDELHKRAALQSNDDLVPF